MEYIVGAANKKVSASAAKPVNKVTTTPISAPSVPVSVETKKQVTKTTVTDVVQPSKSGLFNAAIETISKESGIAPSELTDDCAFDDIGMDSLLCLMVTSRLRDELGVDIDSAKFLDLRTVSGLKNYLADEEPVPPQEVVVHEEVKEQVVENHMTPAAVSGVWSQVVDVISQESGIATAELTDDTAFADAGVDSLLSLLIWSRLKDEVGLDLDHTSPFLDFETIGSFKTYILGASGTETAPSSPQSGSSSSSSSSSPAQTPLWTPGEMRPDTPDSEHSEGDVSPTGQKKVSHHHHSSSFVRRY